MKKKLISFCMVLCMIFPCFFVVACKGKKEGDKVSPYTYSITLKNAKGKVDYSALVGEYDYEKQSKTAWSEQGNDYTISVTRSSVLSGNAIVNLLEGIDYSNLSLTVNGKSANWIVKSGANINCAKDAYIADRQLRYAYSKMSKDTSVVVDFANCGTAKIILDVSDLRKNNVTYHVVEDDFMTIEQAKALSYSAFKTFTSDTITLDYGTVLAFDYSEQLVLNSSSLDHLQKMDYSKYGSRYYVPFNNRVQYLTTQRNGACEIYSISSDDLLNGSLRVLSSSGLAYADSFETLQSKRFISLVQETEYFAGEMLSLSVYKGKNVFIELNEDAQAYNYYLVSNLDEKLSSSQNLITPKIIAETSRKYLEISLTEEDGSTSSARYLVRRPVRESDFFIVYANGLRASTNIMNADAIVIGNKPASFHSSFNDTILYYFKRGSSVRVSIPSTIPDKESNGGVVVRDENDDTKGITLYSQAYNPTTGKTTGALATMFTNSTKYNAMEWTGYQSEPSSLYAFNFTYSEDRFDSVIFSANTNALNLYTGETVYYSATPEDVNSWQKLDASETIELTTYIGKSIYYYIDTNRADAYLFVKNAAGENISETGRLYDCFGRVLTGSVEIDGKKIDLSKVQYLDVVSGYYSYNNLNASIVRGYDESYHRINTERILGEPIMISYSTYEETEFEQIDETTNLEIRYTGLNGSAEIYYYVNNIGNQYLVLKNQSEQIVGKSELIYDNGEAVQINGKYVYCLILNGDYYTNSEEFNIEVVDVTYSLYNEQGHKVGVYTSIYMSQLTDKLIARNNKYYYILCPEGYSLKIVDESGLAVITSFNEMTDVVGQGKLYQFEFEFPSYLNYEPGSSFIVLYEENV